MTLPSNMATKTFSKRIRRCSGTFLPTAAPAVLLLQFSAGIATPFTQKHVFLTGCCCVLHTPWKLFWIGWRKDIFVRLQVCCRVYGRAAEHWEKILCYFTDALGLYTVRPPCSINVNQHTFFWGGNIRSACSGGLRGLSPPEAPINLARPVRRWRRSGWERRPNMMRDKNVSVDFSAVWWRAWSVCKVLWLLRHPATEEHSKPGCNRHNAQHVDCAAARYQSNFSHCRRNDQFTH